MAAMLARTCFVTLMFSAAAGSSLAGPLDITRGSPGEAEIVLTFDAGSSAAGAGEILDLLEEHGIRTTIFVTGQFMESHPEIVLRLVADGHEVANHTWTHLHLTDWRSSGRHSTLPGVSKQRLLDELGRTAAAFRELTGYEMAPYWRAPYGEHNREILQWARDAGWQHVGWTRGSRRSLDALDWVSNRRSRNYLSPEALVQRILDFETRDGDSLEGAIILMHLGSDRPPQERMVRTLPSLISELSSRGFRFVNISELTREGESERELAAR